MVDIVINVLPHAQVTLHSTYSGWIPSFMLISSFFTGVPSKTPPCRKPRYDLHPYRRAPCDTTKRSSMPDLFAAGTDSICRPVRLEYNNTATQAASRCVFMCFQVFRPSGHTPAEGRAGTHLHGTYHYTVQMTARSSPARSFLIVIPEYLPSSSSSRRISSA